MTTNNNNTRQVPRNALQFSLGPMQFSDVLTGEHGPEAPITMFARSAEPIVHWYWGRIVHDMAGMKLRKPTCPIDYCHWDADPIGFLDQFQANNDGLTVSGKLISFKPDDRAANVIFLGGKGVPYEASIDFGDGQAKIEEIPNGMSVQVNGYTFTGPGYVVREWSLLGVAVCPFGADPNTNSEFSRHKNDQNFEVSIFKFSESNMPQEATVPSVETTVESTVKPQQLTQAEAPPDSAKDDLRGQFRKFLSKFGADNGAKWFDEELSYESALEKFADFQKEQMVAKDAEIAQLNKQLAAFNIAGESTPLSSGDAANPPGINPAKLNVHSESMAAFINSLKPAAKP